MQDSHPLLRVCVYEDRKVAMDSLMLMAESLCTVDRNISLHLTVPDAPDSVLAWASTRPEVELTTTRPLGVSGWDAKPWILLQELNAGWQNVLWLDDDMIVTRPVSEIVKEFPPGSLIFADEWGRWTISACDFWGLRSTRTFELFNNCFIRVTQAHRTLMERWLEMTRDPRYREAQALPYAQRPTEAQHDGWLLVALLESDEFGQLPFERIRRGRHIAQCAGSSGYRPLHRIADLFRGLPPLIHALGRKPWTPVTDESRVQRYLLDLATDVSPYVLAAQKVATKINIAPDWLKPRTRLGALSRAATFNHPGMAGFPLASVHALQLAISRIKQADNQK